MVFKESEVFGQEADLWFRDAQLATLKGDSQEYDRCIKQYQAYKKMELDAIAKEKKVA